VPRTLPSLPDQPGTIIDGKYALVELVGEGGMASVWRALTYGAHGVRRGVAVKRVHEQLNDLPDVIAMFIEEARVGALLRHPHIVQIHDFGVDESQRYYLVTEWVEGIHFGDYLRSFAKLGQLAPWPLVTAIGVEVLRGLDAAHTLRSADGSITPVLHRDVSPPNILLDVVGVTKLADFGMARAMDRGRITQPDIVKGKLSYMAPEMAQGHDPTPQSDLFSLGVVLWEAYTGRRLYDGATDVAVLNQVREGRVPLLSAQSPGLPMGLTTAVHRALEREPARRFGSAQEMLEALRQALRVIPETTSGPVLARSISEARGRVTRS
jgi:serine/threonine-protein kinase